MKKTGIIYVATDTARDNLQYVGQTIQKLDARKRKGYNPCFQNAIDHHGDKIKWEIIGKFPIEELDLLECCYIWGLSTIYPNGYNFESGGNKNKCVNKETRRKLSEANKGERNPFYRRHHLEETKRKISEAKTGEKNYTYGKHLPEETRKKISEAQKGEKHRMYGKHHSEETRKKMSKAKENISAETRKKISKTQKGERNSNIKLTELQVLDIRAKYVTGNYTKARLAEEYDVSRVNIYYIINRKSWKHI